MQVSSYCLPLEGKCILRLSVFRSGKSTCPGKEDSTVAVCNRCRKSYCYIYIIRCSRNFCRGNKSSSILIIKLNGCLRIPDSGEIIGSIGFRSLTKSKIINSCSRSYRVHLLLCVCILPTGKNITIHSNIVFRRERKTKGLLIHSILIYNIFCCSIISTTININSDFSGFCLLPLGFKRYSISNRGICNLHRYIVT